MDSSKPIDTLKAILIDLGIPKESLHQGVLLQEDLQLDSTEIVEIALGLKRRLGVSVKLEGRQDMTLDQVCQKVEAAISVRSEHALSIWLAQSELSSFCLPETVRVFNFMEVKKYRCVQHLSSIYAGGIGWVDSNGESDLAIAIRSVYQYDNEIYLNAGAGIVAESVPRNEYIESVNKMKTMLTNLVLEF